MATSTEAAQSSIGVAGKTACVLAEADLWSDELTDALEETGLRVVRSAELGDLFELTAQQPVSLLVLAQRNAVFGVRACRVMRELEHVSLIAIMEKESDLIPVLDAGADDAVINRVDPAVLAARVRALLRRASAVARSHGSIIIRDLVIDLEKYQVLMNDTPVPLTPTEFRLLSVLAQHAGRVVDPRALLSAAHQHDYSERDAQNLVKVHIANLRRKLNDSRSSNPYILCVRGFGYMLERRYQHREGDPLSDLIEAE
jgi:DNA-binding response OmpR family regulator